MLKSSTTIKQDEASKKEEKKTKEKKKTIKAKGNASPLIISKSKTLKSTKKSPWPETSYVQS